MSAMSAAAIALALNCVSHTSFIKKTEIKNKCVIVYERIERVPLTDILDIRCFENKTLVFQSCDESEDITDLLELLEE